MGPRRKLGGSAAADSQTRCSIVMTWTESTFIAAFLWVGWTYIGYPLMLWLRASFFPKPHAPGPLSNASVSIVIAAHNEENTIGRRIGELSGLIRASNLVGEIIVVSDGSTDRTRQISQAAACDGVALRVIVL